MTGLYPMWKQAAETIRNDYKEDPEHFYSDRSLEAMLGEHKDTSEYNFALLPLRDELLRHNIVLLRTRGGGRGPGYKIATDQEKVTLESDRLFRKSRNALIRELTTLYTVDPEKLDKDTLALLEDKQRRCGLRTLATTPRIARKMISYVEIDNRTPRGWLKQIDRKEYEAD